MPSPAFPALQSHVGTFPSFHAAQTPVPGSGNKSSRDLQSLGPHSHICGPAGSGTFPPVPWDAEMKTTSLSLSSPHPRLRTSPSIPAAGSSPLRAACPGGLRQPEPAAPCGDVSGMLIRAWPGSLSACAGRDGAAAAAAQGGIPEGSAALGNAAEPRGWETAGIPGEAFPAVPAEVTPGQRLRALNSGMLQLC